MLLFFLLLLVFLIPIALYCLVLAMINRRPTPLMVRGVWDCVGLLFAASGLLLIVGPSILKLIYRNTVGEVELDRNDYMEAVLTLFVEYWGITVGYFALAATGIVILLVFRRNKTVIYNVDTERFDHVLGMALERLGLGAVRRGRYLAIQRSSRGDDRILDVEAIGPGAISPITRVLPTGEALVSVEAFAAMRNVTLHWNTGNAALRDEIEDELAKHLPEARLFDNPAALWFLGIGGALFSLVLLVIVLLLILPPRRREAASMNPQSAPLAQTPPSISGFDSV